MQLIKGQNYLHHAYISYCHCSRWFCYQSIFRRPITIEACKVCPILRFSRMIRDCRTLLFNIEKVYSKITNGIEICLICSATNNYVGLNTFTNLLSIHSRFLPTPNPLWLLLSWLPLSLFISVRSSGPTARRRAASQEACAARRHRVHRNEDRPLASPDVNLVAASTMSNMVPLVMLVPLTASAWLVAAVDRVVGVAVGGNVATTSDNRGANEGKWVRVRLKVGTKVGPVDVLV